MMHFDFGVSIKIDSEQKFPFYTKTYYMLLHQPFADRFATLFLPSSTEIGRPLSFYLLTNRHWQCSVQPCILDQTHLVAATLTVPNKLQCLPIPINLLGLPKVSKKIMQPKFCNYNKYQQHYSLGTRGLLSRMSRIGLLLCRIVNLILWSRRGIIN